MENSKKCSKCKKIKNFCDFYKRKNSLRSWCKDCEKKYDIKKKQENPNYTKEYYQKNKEYYKKYRQENKEKIKIKRKIYEQKPEVKKRIREYRKTHKRNKEKIKIKSKIYYQKNREKILKKDKIYRKNNKSKINKYQRKYRKDKRKVNVCFKLRNNISNLIRTRLKNHLLSKKGKSTFSFLPYTIDEFKQHLEKQFTKGMSWDNYGYYGWHIDHIKPDSLFNYKSVEDKEFQECWALKNLQPMWAKENIKKGNKY